MCPQNKQARIEGEAPIRHEMRESFSNAGSTKSWCDPPDGLLFRALRLIRPAALALAAPVVQRRRKQNAPTRVAGLQLETAMAVFHPRFFFSTRLLLQELQRLDLAGTTVLDMGTGSGAVGIGAAKSGARVTAVDINESAVLLAARNAAANGVDTRMRCLRSDLFSGLPAAERFDWIIFNPPFYDGAPKTEEEAAWLAGPGLETIERFLLGAASRLEANGSILMICSTDMPLSKVAHMIEMAGLNVAQWRRHQHLFEQFIVLTIKGAASPASASSQQPNGNS